MDVAATWEPIDSLTPHPKNPRHNDGAVDEVAASIRTFGFGSPIIARTADRVIIAGHTRWKAAAKLGMDKVPVRFMDLDPARAAALMLADNKLGELAEWDDALLSELAAEHDLDLTTLGWSDEEAAGLLGGGKEVKGEGDDAEVEPDDGPPDSQPGMVYELGPHRLACGDSTKAETWTALMAGERLQMVWTDPPYGMALDVRYDRMHSGDGHRKTGDRFTPVAGDHAPFDVGPIMSHVGYVKEQFWWGADYYRGGIPEGGSWVVWDKRDSDTMNLDDVIGGQFELCWSKQKHRREIARILWSGHHGMQGADKGARVHPTQKPVALALWFFERWGAAGDLIADPFGGSGTTLIACAMTGRVARLIELDPKYCDVIRRRWTRWARDNGRDPGPGALEARDG